MHAPLLGVQTRRSSKPPTLSAPRCLLPRSIFALPWITSQIKAVCAHPMPALFKGLLMCQHRRLCCWGLLPTPHGGNDACSAVFAAMLATPLLSCLPHAQASALLGVGLLYEGSCHRLMVETMLAEVGRQPCSSDAHGKAGAGSGARGDDEGGVVTDREGYALAAVGGQGGLGLSALACRVEGSGAWCARVLAGAMHLLQWVGSYGATGRGLRADWEWWTCRETGSGGPAPVCVQRLAGTKHDVWVTDLSCFGKNERAQPRSWL